MPTVWVAGSINMDIVATVARFPQIGETVPGTKVFFFPGGKGANQAVAAAKLGVPTALIGRIGADAFGRELRTFLAEQSVDLKFLRETPDAHTGVAAITVAASDNTIVVVPGANALVSERDVMKPAIAKGDILVSQFEIPVLTTEAFFSRARAAGATTILNPAPAIQFDHRLLELVDILILNETELAAIAGRKVGREDTDERIIQLARTLQTREGQIITVTLGRRGAVAWAHERALTIRGEVVESRDATGAGDCFVGAVAAQTALGLPIERALNYATVAASICVQRMGAGPSMPTQSEVASRLESRRR
jgi:ribokinase